MAGRSGGSPGREPACPESAGTLAAATAVPALRAWIDALPLRALIGINAFRFVGIAFLVLAAQGQIAPVFANRAGWGDIATELPFVLIPMFVVPIFLANHVLIFRRLVAAGRRAQ